MGLHNPRTIFLVTLLWAAGCATAGSGDGADAAAGNADAGIQFPDADPNAPDADPNAPDAMSNNNNPDAGGSCPNSPCDLVAQCGCSSPQVCDLNGSQLPSGGTTCRDVTTPGTSTATCSTVNGCAGGYVCLGSSPGQCREYCDPDNDTCGSNGPGSFCNIYIVYDSGGGNYAPVPGAVTCTKSCDPTSTSPTGCPSGFGCHVSLWDPNCDTDMDGVPDGGCTYDGDEYAMTDCAAAPASGGTDGATCTYNSDCAPSFDCINVDSTPQCKQSCVCNTSVASGQVCNTGAVCGTGSCRAFSDPRPTVGGTEYGVCI
jgi:hypothetical protein